MPEGIGPGGNSMQKQKGSIASVSLINIVKPVSGNMQIM